MLVKLVAVWIGILSVFAWQSDGCTCIFRHPQQVVCDADFVIKGTRVGKTSLPPAGTGGGGGPDVILPNFGGDIIYSVYVSKVIKTPKPRKIKEGSILLVRTGPNSAACGVTMTGGEEWLLSGNRTKIKKRKFEYRINFCGWNQPCSQLTSQQLAYVDRTEDVKNSYFGKNNKNCKKCKIVRCPNDNCSNVVRKPQECLYRASRQCYSEKLRCQFQKVKGKKSCRWANTSDAIQCTSPTIIKAP